MGPATLGIHRRLSNKPVLLTPFHQLDAVGIVCDCVLGQTLDENTVEL